MPRSRKIIKRQTLLDPVYNSRLVTKMINKSMKNGKKGAAASQIYDALEIIKTKTSEPDPSKVLEQVISTVAPKMEVQFLLITKEK